uniref:Argonaute2 (AGO2) putative n=1 Tax=Albugo laibachii Nc14 TaxID=890382 RepID=F0X160_9STRA|nr:Argonaute2 (AGO2) putative [Albugo laibachii Nc14]|eukprot:CCA27516.1 Argonaute2 (AGO2) putative [Albugo laibachii Nc14]
MVRKRGGQNKGRGDSRQVTRAPELPNVAPTAPAAATQSMKTPTPAPFKAVAPTPAPPAAVLDLGSLSIETKESSNTQIVSSLQMSLPPRPGFGRLGKQISIFANHFKVNANLGMSLYHYDVSMALQGENFKNEGLSKTVTSLLMISLMARVMKDFPALIVVNDGRKNIYAVSKFPFQEKRFEELQLPDQTKPKLYHCFIKEASPLAVNINQLQLLFQGKLNYMPYDALQALDIAMRHTASSRFVSVGRSLYARNGAKDLGEGAEVWFGHFQSLRATQNHLVLNLDLAATAFVKEMSVLEFLVETLDQRERTLPKTLSKAQASIFSKSVKGVKVSVTHRGDLKRTFRVNGLSKTSAQDLFFDDDSGAKVSVAAYFAKNYGCLRYPGLPCLHVGAMQKKNYLPMEVCHILAGQKTPRKVTDKQVANMIRFTCTKPDDRKLRIEQKLRDAGFERDPVLKAFGLAVNSKMVSAKARILPEPEISYSRGTERPRDGAWNMKNKSFFQSAHLASWAVISMCDPRRCGPDQIKKFFTQVVKQMKEFGMQIPQQLPPIIMKQQRFAKVRDLFKEALTNAQTTFKAPAQIIWLINPVADADVYGELKRTSDIESGIPSQCMLWKHIDKASPQYIANILLKVNTKLGGKNAVVREPLPKVSEAPTIIFGADVTHPGLTERSRPSIAAVVASMDRHCIKHAATLRVQGHRVEQIINLQEMAKELLVLFYKEARVKPTRILFYRDGVSEGQFQMVLNHEISAIRAACASLEKDYMPAITFVVVQKRHNTRLFAADQKDTDRSGNVKAGTVVDTEICHPLEHDFFLMSHGGIQGTSRPTHYHVLLDEIGFTADELQVLTYRLCYTFARCTRSVSMVPSAYYSHLMAFRARFFTPQGDSDIMSSISGSGTELEVDLRLMQVHNNLRNVMYYV